MDKLKNKILGKLYCIKGYPDKKLNSILYISFTLDILLLIFVCVTYRLNGIEGLGFLSSNKFFVINNR